MVKLTKKPGQAFVRNLALFETILFLSYFLCGRGVRHKRKTKEMVKKGRHNKETDKKMVKENMKHGVPLTSFQEQLFDIVIQAYKKQSEKKPFEGELTSKNKQEAFEVEQEPLIENPASRDYPEDTWKDILKFWSSYFIELIGEHINSIFLGIMGINILWMQIVTQYMSIDNPYRPKADTFKLLMISITAAYLILMIIEKTKMRLKKRKDCKYELRYQRKWKGK